MLALIEKNESAHGTELENPLPCTGALPPALEWAVAHVKSRAEKVVVEHFRSWQAPCFLPLLLRKRAYGGRRRESHIPLFPGYVFYDGKAVSRQQVLATNKVAKILFAPEPEKLRRDLENLSLALSKDNALRECRFGEVGTPVAVVEGPLKGLEGTLVRLGGRKRLVIEVKLIGRAVTVNVDAHLCEPVV